MPVRGGRAEHVQDRRTASLARIFLEPETASDPIRGLEADAGDATRQDVGIGANALLRVRAEFLRNQGGLVGSKSCSQEEGDELLAADG